MGLVTTWLRGIGLSHCSAAFRAAGITTPSALSKLTLADYDRLGVVDVNERKKLFYLVQRIKMAVRESTAQDGDENNPNEQSDNVRVGEPTGSRSPTSGLKEPPPPQQPDLKMTKSASYSSAASQLSVNTNRTPSPIDTAMNNVSPKLKEAKLMRNLSFEREEIKKRSATPMTESEDEALEDVVVVPIPTKTKIQLPQKRHELLPPNPPSRDSPRKEFSFEAPSSDEDVAQPSGQTRKKQPSRGTSKIPAPSKRAVQQQRPPNSPYMSSEDEEDQEFLRRQAEEEKKRRRKERLVEQRRRQQEQAEEEERIRLEEEKIAEELEMRRQKEEEEKIRRKQRQVEQMKRKQQQAKEEARLRRLQEEEEEEEEMRRLEEEEEMLRQQQKAQAQARKSRQSLSTPPRHSKPSRSRSTPPTPPDQSSNGAYAVPHQQRRNSSSPNKRPSSSPSHPPLHKIRSRSPSPSPNVPEEAVTYQGNQDAQTWQDFVDYSRSLVNNAENSGQPDNVHDNMRIRVVVRKRPLSKKESQVQDVDVIQPIPIHGHVIVHQPKTRVDLTREVETSNFAFDNSFDADSFNRDIYESTTSNLIPTMFNGGRGSVFAYGQTGSGKTFTMMGAEMTGNRGGQGRGVLDGNEGLYYLAARDVFQTRQQEEFKHFIVTVSLFEIYGGKLYDLLNARKVVKCLEDAKQKVCFPGLSEHVVNSEDDVMSLIQSGGNNRSTGTTSANADSSRSHAILLMSLKVPGRRRGPGAKMQEHGRLTFIDLAGSERGADTSKCDRQTRLEGAEINTSLLALKEVIRALATGGTMQHIPFRGSKLTQVLKDSFVGVDARSVMIACVAPNFSNCEHTINTLRYADRVKEKEFKAGGVGDEPRGDKRRSSYDGDRPTTAPAQVYGGGRKASAGGLVRRSLDGVGRAQEDPQPNSSNNAAAASKIRASLRRRSTAHASRGSNSGPELERKASSGLDAAIEKNFHKLLEPVNNGSNGSNGGEEYFDPDEDTDDEEEERMREREARTEALAAKAREDMSKAAADLISSHRNAMTSMLGMVKKEMNMVNKTDADRDNLEQYIDELDALQERKVDMLGAMKQSLKKFKAAREIVRKGSSSNGNGGGKGSRGSKGKPLAGGGKMARMGRRATVDHLKDLEDVDDFEDLR